MREPFKHLIFAEMDGTRGGAGWPFLPFRQFGEQPALALFGHFKPLANGARPGPAQTRERLERVPCALTLWPDVFRGNCCEQCLRCSQQKHRDVALIARWFQLKHGRQPLGRRHHKPRGMDERKQFQKIKPGKLGIAQPLPYQRRIEQDHRRLARPRNRLPPAKPPRRAIRRGNPDAAMTGVDRGIGKLGGHNPLCPDLRHLVSLWPNGILTTGGYYVISGAKRMVSSKPLVPHQNLH